MTFAIDQRTARRLLLSRQLLCEPPHIGMAAGDLLQMITKLGFVQVDSINTVERAHHMILFSRNQTYKPEHLKALLENDRSLFENWTHDAAIVPSSFYPYWQHQFAQANDELLERWRKWRRHGFEKAISHVLQHVDANGPTRSRDLTALDDAGNKTGAAKKGGSGWWDWHPSKTALEYLWRTGQLAICGRDGFQKIYDLSHRVIPAAPMSANAGTQVPREEMIDWACRGALDRLGVATAGELAAFWAIITPAEAKVWCAENLGRGLMDVSVDSPMEAKPRAAYACEELRDELENIPSPPNRVRVLSPFDPVLRDRKRAYRLFGFDYRIEVFVPAAKRKYGYYVFPLLRGDRFIGRVDMKHDRSDGKLHVNGLWYEPGVRQSKALRAGILAELERMRRFTGADALSINIAPELLA
jgi:uncharacterized protein YcaQ